MLTWRGCEYTNTGSVRSLNEDSVLDCSAQALWAVADGMGGHEGGDYASQWITRQLSTYSLSRYRGVAINRITRLLALSNLHLVDKAAAEHAGIIGSTVAALSIHGSQAVCSWSGDSRIYRVRGQSIRQLTRDHSYQCLSEDRDRHTHPESIAGGDGQALTGAIGGNKKLQLEHCWYALDPQDRFLLCTDGLYKEVSDSQIYTAVSSGQSAEKIVEGLASLYFQGSARDNVGMVYVRSVNS